MRHEDNIINEIGWVPATQELYKCLCYPPQRRGIAELTVLHLGLNGDSHRNPRCIVQKPITWIRGSFSVCLPIHEEDEVGKTVRKVLDCAKVLMRCPMAHKLAEDRYPGTVDEKLSCEAVTSIWRQGNCPDIYLFRNCLDLGFQMADM